MKKVLVGFMTGLLCVMPAAGVMAEDAAAETTNEAQAGTEETTAEGEGVQTGAQALSDDIYSFQAEIDGEVYQFPMSYGEFTAKGWTYDGDAAQTMEPEQYTTAETFKKDSSKLYATIFNLGMNTVPFSECQIGGFSVDSYMMKDSAFSVKLPKGIEFGVSTLEDVKAAYGEPSREYDGEMYTALTYEYETYQDVEIQVDKETKVVSKIDMRNIIETASEEEKAQAETAVSDEVTEEVKSYQAPTELGDDLTKFIVEYDGALYQMPAPVSEFEKNGWTVKEDQSDMTVKGKDAGWVSLMKNNQELRVMARNYGDNATTIRNCFVTTVKGDDNSTDMPITVQKGITRGMTKADLEKALEGVTYEFEESDMFEYYTVEGPESSLDSVQILVRKDTSVVQAIEVSYMPRELAK